MTYLTYALSTPDYYQTLPAEVVSSDIDNLFPFRPRIFSYIDPDGEKNGPCTGETVRTKSLWTPFADLCNFTPSSRLARAVLVGP